MEKDSDTPDFILAEYIMGCLVSYEKAVSQRDKFFGRQLFKDRESIELKAPVHQNES